MVLGFDGSRILGTVCDNCKLWQFWMRYGSYLERRLYPITQYLYLITSDRLGLDGKTVVAFISTAMPGAKMVRFGRVVLQSRSVNCMF